MTQVKYIQFSFENLLRVVESAVQSTDARRTVNLSNCIIEYCIGDFGIILIINRTGRTVVRNMMKLCYCRRLDPDGSYP